MAISQVLHTSGSTLYHLTLSVAISQTLYLPGPTVYHLSLCISISKPLLIQCINICSEADITNIVHIWSYTVSSDAASVLVSYTISSDAQCRTRCVQCVRYRHIERQLIHCKTRCVQCKRYRYTERKMIQCTT